MGSPRKLELGLFPPPTRCGGWLFASAWFQKFPFLEGWGGCVLEGGGVGFNMICSVQGKQGIGIFLCMNNTAQYLVFLQMHKNLKNFISLI